MKLIIGLGNPGEKYEETRHNVGFMVLDELLRELEPVKKTVWQENKKLQSLMAQKFIKGTEIILAKPQTFMNASGYPVKKLVDYYQIELAEIWVVHDDLDLPLGKIKIRIGGGIAGHHGLESIIRELESGDFIRFRLGIGHPLKGDEWYVSQGGPVDKNVKHKEVEEYVLEEFRGKDKVEAEKMIKKAVGAIELALESGLEAAMNKYNLK